MRFADVDLLRKPLGLDLPLEKDLISGLVLLGIPSGGEAGEVAEGTDKVGVVQEAGQLSGLLDADSLLKQLPGPEYPAVDDILHHGEASGGFEDAAQIVLADVELAGDLVQGEWLGQVVTDVVQDGGDPEKVLVLDGLPGSGGVEGGGQARSEERRVGKECRL